MPVVTTAATGAIEAALEISGTLAPRLRVGVKPKMPGSLDRVLVDIGDTVKAKARWSRHHRPPRGWTRRSMPPKPR